MPRGFKEGGRMTRARGGITIVKLKRFPWEAGIWEAGAKAVEEGPDERGRLLTELIIDPLFGVLP